MAEYNIYINGSRDFPRPHLCPWCGHVLTKTTMTDKPDPRAIVIGVCMYCGQPNIKQADTVRKPLEGELTKEAQEIIRSMQKMLMVKE